MVRLNEDDMPDPLIDEVRAIRRSIAERFDNDIDRMCEHFAEQERMHPERIYRPEHPVTRSSGEGPD